MPVEVRNVSQLQHKLRALPESVREEAVDAIQEGAVRIRNQAKSNVRDGDVRDSIRKRQLEKGLDARVGTRHWRAKFEEFGTKAHVIRPKRKKALYSGGATSLHTGEEAGEFGPVSGEIRHPGQPPRPFLHPAFEAERPRIRAEIVAAIRAGLRRVARR